MGVVMFDLLDVVVFMLCALGSTVEDLYRLAFEGFFCACESLCDLFLVIFDGALEATHAAKAYMTRIASSSSRATVASVTIAGSVRTTSSAKCIMS